ncbi:hypothetical protein ADL29_33885 [Streptomyces chattanoogensis]|uniref:Uncharacterized protein n=2 Tax=Streptomyces chattanoogensis TaxID=66876 RepID=A0A0N0GVZ5_9ACTN|nr:hypothetical protein ADL29_33885 [Streptomyces chattanoogensis]
MGERLSGDGAPVRHRHGHPDGSMSGPGEVHDSATLETVLGAAIRTHRLDAEAEQRALAAFRAAAHGADGRRARTRRRDDWRPREERSVRRPARMTFGMVFAGLTLGGVAVAAVGSAGSSTGGAGTGRGTAHPSAVAPGRPGGTASPSPSGRPGPTDRPSPAQDIEAHCRAYKQVEGRGKALDATAWQRLVAAAGGKDKVAAYCSEQLTRATGAPSGPADTGRPGNGAANAGNGTAGNAGASGNGTPDANPSSTHNATGNGRAGEGNVGGKHQ